MILDFRKGVSVAGLLPDNFGINFKRQQRRNEAVAALLPLLTDLKNRLEVLRLRLEGTQSKIFHMRFRDYADQCRIRRTKARMAGRWI